MLQANVVFLNFVLLLSGCATTYQPMGWRGGYADSYLGNDTYVVEFAGNGYTHHVDARNYALRRAQEVCLEHGYSDFEVTSLRDSTHYEPQSYSTNCRVNGYGYSTSANCETTPDFNPGKPRSKVIVKCSGSRMPAAEERAIAEQEVTDTFAEYENYQLENSATTLGQQCHKSKGCRKPKKQPDRK